MYLFTAEHNIYNISNITFTGIMYNFFPCLPLYKRPNFEIVQSNIADSLKISLRHNRIVKIHNSENALL